MTNFSLKPRLILYKMNSMRYFSTILLLLFLILNLSAQTAKDLSTGVVSYVSSQHVYVKFDNTEQIRLGDTLFLNQGVNLIPVLKVQQISSISCVGTPISDKPISISTILVYKPHTIILRKDVPETVEAKVAKPVSVYDQAVKNSAKKMKRDSKSKVDGRISLSSYSNLSNSSTNQRFRYNVSLNAQNIKDSKFSGESYISFSHKSNDWNQIGKNVFSALKIYTLAVKYDLDSTSNIWLGRRINVNMANVGAVDGLQYEKYSRNMTYGVVAGSRPDYSDYGFNPNLLQYGAFIGHRLEKENGSMQSSIAFFNQMNNFITDRRFAYLQHNNSFAKNLNLFCSFEIDFYALKNLQPVNTIDLTSSYVSLNYKPFRKLSLHLSYDARKNIYYYETFKTTIDSVLDKELRQGLRFQFNYRPFKFLNWGGFTGYRFQKSDPKPSIHASSYININDMPLIHASTTFTATMLKAAYMDGMIYGVQFSRDLIPGKLSTDLEGRLVNGKYTNSSSTLNQMIGEVGLSWRITKKLYMSADYEATFEKDNNAGRVFVNLTKRF